MTSSVRKIKESLLAEKGFSLVEISLALGLVGGLSLVTMKMVQTQVANDTLLKGRAEIQKQTAMVKTLLNNPDSCRYMLKGMVIGTNSAPEPVTLPEGMPPGLPNGLYRRVSTVGGAFYEPILLAVTPQDQKYRGVRTNGIRLRWQAGFGSGGAEGTAEIIIDYRIERNGLFDDRSDSNDRVIQKIVSFQVKADVNDPGNLADDQIEDCGPVVSDSNSSAKERFCLSLGNYATWDGTDCSFTSMQCLPNEVPERYNPDGTISCVPAETQLDPPVLFDTTTNCTITSSRVFRIQAVGGRLRLVCL